MTDKTHIKSDIQTFWKHNPMTYGEVHGQPIYGTQTFELGTNPFFDQVDKRFYSWNKPLHTEKPFGKLFPFEHYKDKKVLEIGCGMGTMLMNWAQNGAHCTGIDLNPTSIQQSKKRFELLNLPVQIEEGDANRLNFESNTFDYVYSWGVLHHSPNLSKSIEELFRVLKPKGGFGIMLYNRASLYEAYMIQYIEGFLHNERQWLSSLELNSRYGDGHQEEGNPHTWPVTPKEGLSLLKSYSQDASANILGTDVDCVIQYLLPGISKYIPKFLLKPIARRWGWSIWFQGHKSE